MPLVAEPAPLMESPRRTTVWRLWGAVSLVMLMMIPATPALRIPPTPVGLPSMVIDLVMVTVPNPPGSRQSISPSTAVFEIAPANVLHGAVRLHGLASSPTPDTQVRVACAWAGVAYTRGTNMAPINTSANSDFVVGIAYLTLNISTRKNQD